MTEKSERKCLGAARLDVTPAAAETFLPHATLFAEPNLQELGNTCISTWTLETVYELFWTGFHTFLNYTRVLFALMSF